MIRGGAATYATTGYATTGYTTGYAVPATTTTTYTTAVPAATTYNVIPGATSTYSTGQVYSSGLAGTTLIPSGGYAGETVTYTTSAPVGYTTGGYTTGGYTTGGYVSGGSGVRTVEMAGYNSATNLSGLGYTNNNQGYTTNYVQSGSGVRPGEVVTYSNY